MSRTVYAIDPHGALVGACEAGAISGWTNSSDNVILKTARGVFIGLGILEPKLADAVTFEIFGADAGADHPTHRRLDGPHT